MNKYLASAALIAASSLCAVSVNADNFYVDLSYVKSTADQTRGGVERGLRAQGFDARVSQFDATHESLRPTLGYAFTPNHALEISYLNLGDVTAHVSAPTFDEPVFNAAVANHLPQSAEGATLSYRGSLRLDEYWTGSIEFGVYHWKAESQFGNATRKTDGTDFLWGARLDYQITSDWQLGVQATHIQLPQQTAELLSAGVRYRF